MIAAVIVYYNPEEGINKNIKDVIGLVDKIFIIDNSSKDNTNLIDISNEKIEYIPLLENKGISYRFNHFKRLIFSTEYVRNTNLF